MMAAARGPASRLPTCIQLRKPRATGHIAFFGQVVAQFQLRMVQEAAQPAPKCQRVVASPWPGRSWEGAGPGSLDARLDLFESPLVSSGRRILRRFEFVP